MQYTNKELSDAVKVLNKYIPAIPPDKEWNPRYKKTFSIRGLKNLINIIEKNEGKVYIYWIYNVRGRVGISDVWHFPQLLGDEENFWKMNLETYFTGHWVLIDEEGTEHISDKRFIP